MSEHPVVRDPLLPMLSDLLECLETSLEHYGAGACRYVLAPGSSLPWDVCCECNSDHEGQAWVAVERVFPAGPFPNPDSRPMRCGVREYAAEVVVSVLRCAATADERSGEPPGADRLIEDALKVSRDRAILREVLECCFLGDAEPGTFRIGEWTPLGPTGGCVGGQVRLTLAVPTCRCPEHLSEA